MGWFSSSKDEKKPKKNTAANARPAQNRARAVRQPAGNEAARNLIQNNRNKNIVNEKDDNDIILINVNDKQDAGEKGGQEKIGQNIVNENKDDNIIAFNDDEEDIKEAPGEQREPAFAPVTDVAPEPEHPKYNGMVTDGPTVLFADDDKTIASKRPKDKSKNAQSAANQERILNPKPSIIDNLDELEEEEHAQELAQAQNRNAQSAGIPGFVPQRRPSSGTGIGQHIKNKTGFAAGKILNTAASTLTLPILAAYTGHHMAVSSGIKKYGQQSRTHSLIPGWHGEKFENPNADGLEMLEDQRRIPTIWAYSTAGRPLNEDGTIMDPEITAYMRKTSGNEGPSGGSSDNPETGGHGFLGLRYSIYSPKSKRMERKEIIYGLYQAGGMVNKYSTNAAMALKGAMIPAQMRNDRNSGFNYSRRYPAKPWQLAAIVKASETYADKGYNLYKRNCVSFVRDMLVNTARLETGGDLFKEEEVKLGAVENAVLGIGGGGQAYFDEYGLGVLQKMAGQKDTSYQGYGNMRATAEDIVRYKDSQTNFLINKKALTPGLVGSRLVSTSQTSTGTLGALGYARKLGTTFRAAEVRDMVNVLNLMRSLSQEKADLKKEVTKILPENMQRKSAMPRVIAEFMGRLDGISAPLTKLNEIIVKYKKNHKHVKGESECLSFEELRTAYEAIEKSGADISRIYSQTLKGDPRLDGPVSKILSLIEMNRRYLNQLYEEKGSDTGPMSDLQVAKQEFSTRDMSLKFGKSTRIGDDTKITPSHYEAYLQVYGSPQAAAEKYKRYVKLDRIEDARMTKQEKAEYAQLARMEAVARDYDMAHQYMLERENYSQQDLDYIFALQKRETSGLKNPRELAPFNAMNSASGIYQSAVMEKILGGMKQHYLSSPAHYKDEVSVKAWVNNYVSQRLKMHQGLLTMIVRAMLRANIDQSDDKLREAVSRMIGLGYIRHVFAATGGDDTLQLARANARSGFEEFSTQKNTPYRALVDGAIQRARSMEKKGASLETLKESAFADGQNNAENGPQQLPGLAAPKRIYNTGEAKKLSKTMSSIFATDKGYAIYSGFQKELRKVIEKAAGKNAAKCSAADTTRFLARACCSEMVMKVMLSGILTDPWKTDKERKQRIKDYKVIIETLETKVSKEQMQEILREMQVLAV